MSEGSRSIYFISEPKPRMQHIDWKIIYLRLEVSAEEERGVGEREVSRNEETYNQKKSFHVKLASTQIHSGKGGTSLSQPGRWTM